MESIGDNVEQYIVAYAKIVESKENGINLDGVFFGGIGSSKAEADKIARDCVNSIRGGTILPKIKQLNGKNQVVDALYDLADNFESITLQMIEASQTIQKAQKRKRR